MLTRCVCFIDFLYKGSKCSQTDYATFNPFFCAKFQCPLYICLIGSQWNPWACGCRSGCSLLWGCPASNQKEDGPDWPWGWNHWCWSHELTCCHYGWFQGKKLWQGIDLEFSFEPYYHSQCCPAVGPEPEQPICTEGDSCWGSQHHLGGYWWSGRCQEGTAGVGAGMNLFQLLDRICKGFTKNS